MPNTVLGAGTPRVTQSEQVPDLTELIVWLFHFLNISSMTLNSVRMGSSDGEGLISHQLWGNVSPGGSSALYSPGNSGLEKKALTEQLWIKAADSINMLFCVLEWQLSLFRTHNHESCG